MDRTYLEHIPLFHCSLTQDHLVKCHYFGILVLLFATAFQFFEILSVSLQEIVSKAETTGRKNSQKDKFLVVDLLASSNTTVGIYNTDPTHLLFSSGMKEIHPSLIGL